MANKQIRVVIIVPTYNERENVKRLVPVLVNDIFPQIQADYSMHVLIVDDSSPDGTAAVAKGFSEEHTNVHLLVNKEKGGLGKAYSVGMWYALKTLNADVVFEFDADFSHDPKKIEPMIAKLAEGNDLVLGSRYIPGGSIPADWGFHRKFLSKVGNRVIQLIITNFSIHDWTTGYRAVRRSVVEAVLPEMNDDKFTGYTFQIGFLHKAVRKGFRVAEVPINFVDRTYGSSKLGAEYIKNTLRYILKVRWNEIVNHRLFKFSMVGVIGAIVQLTSLQLLRRVLPYQLAYFLSVEAAVASNFIWSNLWTFADRKLELAQVPIKFIQFNLGSAGSIVIQQTLAFVVENMMGLFVVFTMPLLGIEVDTGLLAAIAGILLGMVWNYAVYSRIIWKKIGS